MLELPKILAPVDFSERSLGAAGFAARLATHFHSELTLLHVLDSSVYELTAAEAADPAIRELSDGWRRRTEALLTKFPPGDVLSTDVRRIVLSGRPPDVIVSFARFNHTSLIVIPTRGAESFRPCLLGSVAAEILNDTACPVLTGIHTREVFPQGPGGFRKILCAVDFCPQSLKALTWASQFATKFHAQLAIAHVTPSTEGGVGEFFNPDRRRNWVTEARLSEFATQAQQKIEEMQKLADTAAPVLIDSSIDVPQAVCLAASQVQADLVVVGRGSSSRVDRKPTKVYSIVRQSPCPVLSI